MKALTYIDTENPPRLGLRLTHAMDELRNILVMGELLDELSKKNR